MRLTQKLPAVVTAALLAGTWAVPALIAHEVPAPSIAVGAHDRQTLETYTGAEISYEVPAGWTTTPSSDSGSVVYTKATDDQELTISVVGGSKDFDVTADRILRENSVAGTSAAFDGEQVSTAGGFTGRSCVAIKPALKATGPCAVVHRGGVVVAVIATSTDAGDVPDLQGLLDSLELTKEESE